MSNQTSSKTLSTLLTDSISKLNSALYHFNQAQIKLPEANLPEEEFTEKQEILSLIKSRLGVSIEMLELIQEDINKNKH